jgi:hypothetical protein
MAMASPSPTNYITRRHGNATDPGSAEADSSKTEILVRFRSNVSRDAIDNITSRMNDEVEDRIEAVDGLEVIEDEDNRSADEVVAQYRALAEVEYAEANSEIKLDMKAQASTCTPTMNSFTSSGGCSITDRMGASRAPTSARCRLGQ